MACFVLPVVADPDNENPTRPGFRLGKGSKTRALVKIWPLVWQILDEGEVIADAGAHEQKTGL
jgi:hypothetical protein